MTKITQAARDLAQRAHLGEKRKWSGLDYFAHPCRVAYRMALMGGTEDMVAAAYLHDVLENTAITEAEILAATNQNVLDMVKALTNASTRSPLPRAMRKEMDRAKLTTASKEVKLIKLIDRIDNLKEMHGAPEDFRSLYARESLLLVDVIGDADVRLASELIRLASSV